MAEFDPTQYRHYTDPQLQFLSVVALNEGVRSIREGSELLAEDAVFEWNTQRLAEVDQLASASVEFRFLSGIVLTKIDFLAYAAGETDEDAWAVGSDSQGMDTEFLDDSGMEDFLSRFKRAHDSGLFVPQSP